jgi:hypothetical protein
MTMTAPIKEIVSAILGYFIMPFFAVKQEVKHRKHKKSFTLFIG